MCATLNQKDVPENFYRPNNGRTLNWYIRLVPPLALKNVEGVNEYRKSTGTADLRKAKTIGAQLIATKRAEWDQLLTKIKTPASLQIVLSAELVEHICALRLYHWMRIDDAGRYEGAGYTETVELELSNLCNVTDHTMRSVLARGRASDSWDEVLGLLDYWCNQIDFQVSRTDPLYPSLVRAFAEVELRATSKIMSRNEGEATDTPKQPRPIGATLSVMTEVFREYKQKSSRSKFLGTTVSVWLRLIEHLGDVPLNSVNAAGLYDFLETRLRSPVKPWSMQYAHGTVKRTLREFFALARTRGLLDGKNPVDDLDVLPMLTAKEEKSRKKPRRPFSNTQLTSLFASEWYKPDSKSWTGKMKDDLGARYWVPLICMTHGNRVREVLQLVASDIAIADEVPILRITDEMEGVQLLMDEAGVVRNVKTPATRRIVPLHPLLLSLGFLEFVRGRAEADGPNALLFPSSLPEPGGKSPMLGRAYEQAFLRHVRDAMKFGRGYGSHGLRHQLEDRIRAAQRVGSQWPPGLALAFMGRARVKDGDETVFQSEGSADEYGDGYAPNLMLEYIAQLDFSRIVMPLPFKLWLKVKEESS